MKNKIAILLVLILAFAMMTIIQGSNTQEERTASETWSGEIYLNETHTVESGETLIIEPGTIIKLCENISINVKGTLIAEGTENNNIIFTHSHTNEYWERIFFYSGSTDSVLNYCKIEYGGWWKNPNTGNYENAGAISSSSSSLTISHCIISENKCGIYCYDGSYSVISYNKITSNNGIGIYTIKCSPKINNNILSENGQNGVMCRRSSPTVTYNSIFENSKDGVWCIYYQIIDDLPTINYNNIYNNSGDGVGVDASTCSLGPFQKVNAKNNWWGSDDGPSGAGPGSGDSVSEGVEYEPWLTERIGVEPPHADFTYIPSSPKTGETIQFTDASTDDVTIDSWSWDFGDGNSGEEKNPIHDYIKAGTYNVVLRVTDNDDMIDNCTKNVTISLNGSDTDNDGIPDNLDNDRDGDGWPNNLDAYPDDPLKYKEEAVKAEKTLNLVPIVVAIVIIVLILVVIAITVSLRKKRK